MHLFAFIACTCFCILLGWGYKGGKDLRNCNILELIFLVTTYMFSTSFYFSQNLGTTSNWSQSRKNSHQQQICCFSLLWKKIFFLPDLKTRLGLTICNEGNLLFAKEGSSRIVDSCWQACSPQRSS